MALGLSAMLCAGVTHAQVVLQSTPGAAPATPTAVTPSATQTGIGGATCAQQLDNERSVFERAVDDTRIAVTAAQIAAIAADATGLALELA
ncbi:MAG: hypothetical protein KJ832_17055, partial [Gammaproteobacteria bacterium]|nr:hypothetical protein [Gammaproteobacteria bacterium]